MSAITDSVGQGWNAVKISRYFKDITNDEEKQNFEEKQKMKLTFSSHIEAADTERRVIAGKIVPFGEIGNTSAGPVVFQKGSIKIGDPGKIKMLMQHKADKPIGRMQKFQQAEDGILLEGFGLGQGVLEALVMTAVDAQHEQGFGGGGVGGGGGGV